MLDKEMVEKELDKLIKIRTDFIDYLDRNIPKKSNNMEFDFENNPKLDAKDVYEHFFKLDYQARKLRGFLVSELGLKAE
ncbi:hypothetical protein ACKGJI_02165 [Sulfurospirillum sp. 1307]|jgi:hypothetical protein